MAVGFSTRKVAQLAGIDVERVRAFARAGLLSCTREHGRYRYTFQDVVLLRMAQELIRAKIPNRRVWNSLRLLKRRLPRGRSLSALRVVVEGGRILVKEPDAIWQPESGQLQLQLTTGELTGEIAPLVRAAVESARKQNGLTADDWYNLGFDLELVEDHQEAQQAYRKALQLDEKHADAHVNLGRLLHMAGAMKEAEQHYRKALDSMPQHATAAYNLGLVLEALQRRSDALQCYQDAIKIDPEFCDAYYNLGNLYEEMGDRRAALRCLTSYKRLTGGLGSEQ